MLTALAEHQTAIRLSAFGGVFAAMALWELIAPRRALNLSRWQRWPNNIGIVVLNSVLVRFLIPTAAVGIALTAESEAWGLFNQLQLPAWIEIVAAILLLDFIIYLQHVTFHAVPVLWRNARNLPANDRKRWDNRRANPASGNKKVSVGYVGVPFV